MFEHPGKKKLEELVAGLDGVTPGPWQVNQRGEITSEKHEGRHVVAASDLVWGLNRSGANAAHLARCDPDSIRSISDAYKAMDAENARLREALTPSAWTKAAYIGEFFETVEMPNPDYDEDNEDDEDSSESIAHRVPVSWTTIKKIMAAILVHASALKGVSRDEG